MVIRVIFYICLVVFVIYCEGLNIDIFVVESGNFGGKFIENEIGFGWKIVFDNLDIF